MLTKIISKLRTKYVEDTLNESNILKMGHFFIKEYWVDNHDVTKDFSPDFVAKQAEEMMGEVIKISHSDNPRMTNRQILSNFVVACASFQVLVIAPPPAADETGLRGQFGISGELKEHLLELSGKNKALKEFMYGICQPKTWDDVWNPVLLRYRAYYAWMSVFHALRGVFDDINPSENGDWFKLFFAVTCGWHEHQYRKDIGLPSKLDYLPKDTELQAIMLATFVDRVQEGTRYPDLAWKESLEGFKSNNSK